MSTFNGIVSEFPQIRIDFFRTNPSKPPPLACFLSHIHSDHLQGLESLKAPFVYCSPATRRLLLRMEKYPHRMNFAKGILEVRKQHYRHLQLILKAVPLQTQTEIDLSAKVKIRITLFDANHCPGAVMFLIEGDDKAVLYTGDIRSESWWVNSIVRNPVLIPYTFGQKRLDCMYLDTTFATKHEIYQDFPSKAEGMQELLQKVQECPRETIFYFRAWTLGYEDVWLALSAALDSKVHVDDYQSRLYRSLSEETRDNFSVSEAPALNGFAVGNHSHPGCLTGSSEARIHSCEPGTACHAKLAKNKNVVWITPIITRSREGADVYEIGAGGGGGDLYQMSELDMAGFSSMQALEDLCVELIKDPEVLARTLQRMTWALTSRNLRMSLEDLGLETDAEVTLKQFIALMAKSDTHDPARTGKADSPTVNASKGAVVSGTIHFPFSRHSSYNELRHLVSLFKPRDICPCTVDEESWSEEVSMQLLFGDLCSGHHFEHDRQLRQILQERKDQCETAGRKKRKRRDTRDTQNEESFSSGSYETAQPTVNMNVTVTISHENLNQAPTTSSSTPPHSHNGNEPDPQVKSLPNRNGARSGSNTTSALSVVDLIGEEETQSSGPNANLEAIKAAFQAMNNGNDKISLRPLPPEEQGEAVAAGERSTEAVLAEYQQHEEEPDAERESQSSVATSAFQSQSQRDSEDRKEVMRLWARKEAYRAAKRCLFDRADSGGWNDLSLRSVGRKGHSEEEIEL